MGRRRQGFTERELDRITNDPGEGESLGYDIDDYTEDDEEYD